MERINNFPDKKVATTDYDRITALIQESADIRKDMDVGQERATWLANGEYPELPIMVVYMTDVHYGSVGVDYDLLNQHFKIVQETPNAFAFLGGDGIDNFAIKHAHAGIMGDAIPPQVQAQAFMSKLLEIDRAGKLSGVCFGNHEDWVGIAGLDFYQTFMGDLQAPIFTRGGMMHAIVGGGQEYKIGIGHKHWGVSKLNPENAARRGMEFSWPGADIVLIGDDHQATGAIFDRGGERKMVVDGGTYKVNDPTGKKWGLGPAGQPGYTIMLWPDRKKFALFDDPEVAQQYIQGRIWNAESEARRLRNEE